MATKALTPEQIFLCADQLVQEGRKPTLAALRERLGSGSMSTLQKSLSQWKAQRQVASPPSSLAPSDVPALLRAVQSEIERAVEQVRLPLQEEILSLKNEAAEWSREIERLESEKESLEERLVTTTSERNALEGRMIGRTEELLRELQLLRQELERERREKAEAREKAAELWGRLTQIQKTNTPASPPKETLSQENESEKKPRKESS